ncbi:MAG TPA: hypothetical protein DCM38_07480 [Gammaproteobacteria bacterium]|nr:hypothetical protein [Gammaproteobacteria bacterium]
MTHQEKVRVGYQAIRELDKLKAPHQVARDILRYVIDRQGLLRDKDNVLAKLGVSKTGEDVSWSAKFILLRPNFRSKFILRRPRYTFDKYKISNIFNIITLKPALQSRKLKLEGKDAKFVLQSILYLKEKMAKILTYKKTDI